MIQTFFLELINSEEKLPSLNIESELRCDWFPPLSVRSCHLIGRGGPWPSCRAAARFGCRATSRRHRDAPARIRCSPSGKKEPQWERSKPSRSSAGFPGSLPDMDRYGSGFKPDLFCLHLNDLQSKPLQTRFMLKCGSGSFWAEIWFCRTIL